MSEAKTRSSLSLCDLIRSRASVGDLALWLFAARLADMGALYRRATFAAPTDADFSPVVAEYQRIKSEQPGNG